MPRLSDLPREYRAAAACGLVALVLALATIVAIVSQQDWRLNALVRMDRADDIADYALESDPGFVFWDGHYDGVYFYAIARDPFATATAHQLIDRAPYRYGHAGFGWMAGLVSLGNPRWIPAALAILASGGLVAATVVGSLLFARFGITPWAGLVIPLNPGLLFSVSTVTSEPIGAALLLGFLFSWVTRRRLLAGFLLIGLVLVKEWFVLVPVAVAAWELVHWRGHFSIRSFVGRIAPLVPAPLAFGAWYIYLKIRFGRFPHEDALDALVLPPLHGWFDSLGRAVAQIMPGGESSQIGGAAVPLLLACLGVLLLGIVVASRFRTPADPVFILMALLLLFGTWLILLYPKDLMRMMALPLVLLPLVLFAPPLAD